MDITSPYSEAYRRKTGDRPQQFLNKPGSFLKQETYCFNLF
jgi:hypothetical protein